MIGENVDEPDIHSDAIEIVITEADLEVAAEQSQNVSRFFANPEPKPLTPTALVETKCVKAGRKYYMVFEKRETNDWAIQYTIDDSLPTISGGAANITVENDLVSGQIDWSNLTKGRVKCPYCANSDVVKCGKCKRMSCHFGSQGSPFECGWCGNTGHVKGYIQTIDGTKGKGKVGKT